MKTRHPVEGSFGNEFPSIYNQCGVIWRHELQDVERNWFFAFFWKNYPFGKNFQKFYSEWIYRDSDFDVLYSNFVKFGWWEIGKVVRYLPDKRKQNFDWLSSSRYCADRLQNMSWPAADNVLTVLQISSKSAHVRRSYIRMREHQSALESESNIRLKLSFEPNKNHQSNSHQLL